MIFFAVNQGENVDHLIDKLSIGLISDTLLPLSQHSREFCCLDKINLNTRGVFI
jgi:hypothetical protein